MQIHLLREINVEDEERKGNKGKYLLKKGNVARYIKIQAITLKSMWISQKNISPSRWLKLCLMCR